MQIVQERPILRLVNEITKHAENRQALRWLANELAWERVLTGLREGEVVEAPAARAA